MNDTFHNVLDIEKQLLGCILMDSTTLNSLKNLITPEDFYGGTHNRLFALLLKMHEAGDAIDMMTVVEVVASSEGPERNYGGAGYVAGLVDRVVTMLHVEQYAHLIRQSAVRRMLMMGMKSLVPQINDGESDIVELIEKCAELARRASMAAPGKSMWKGMPEIIDAHDDELVKRIDAAENKQVIGVPTGLGELDHLVQGLRPGKLYIIAARPAMGKSALLGNILTNATREGHRCAEFSLEMGDVELLDRQIADVASVNYGQLQRGRLDAMDRRRIDDTKETMWHWPLHLDDTPTRTIDQMCAAARQLKAKHPDLALIGVDYLQLASSTGGRNSVREQEVSKISRGLKLLARELDVAVVCLGQLNRECERRPNKRPLMSDLRESGAIEQDADFVMFVYREEYYNPETPDAGLAELIVRKHRGFARGTVKVSWTPEYQRFATLARNVVPIYGAAGDFTADPDEAVR
jgi:replicative DNA helicase